MNGLEAAGRFHETAGRAAAQLWPALADHLWQAALFVFIVWVATLLLARARAGVRFVLWLIAAFKFLLPPFLLAAVAARLGLNPSALSAGATDAGAPLVLRFAEPVSNALEVTVSAGAPHSEIYCVLTIGWLTGAVVCAAVWRMRGRAVRASVRAGREVVEGREFEALLRARQRLGLTTQRIRLVLTPQRVEPGVWRVQRPVIVISDEVADDLDDEELESVMLHELAHVERRDNLTGLFQAALCCLFWFHPFVWMVNRRLLEERERACDERVLEAGGSAAAYAAGILKIVRFCFGRRAAGASSAAAGTDLRRRIEMILSTKSINRASRRQRALPFAAAGAALALTLGPAVFSGSRTAAQSGAGGTQSPVAGSRALTPGVEQGPAVREVLQTPETLIIVENAPGAPLVLTDARMRIITRELFRRAQGQLRGFVGEIGEADFYATLPSITVMNVSGKRITEVGFGYAKPNGHIGVMTGHAASIAPGESQTFAAEWSRHNVVMPGDASDIKLKLVWAIFDDGSRWGRAPAPLPPPPPPPSLPPPPRAQGHSLPPASPLPSEPLDDGEPSPDPSPSMRDEGVSLRGQIIDLPRPVYPRLAREVRAEGRVVVQVTVDEEGKVIGAEATAGHPLLRDAAVDAARMAKFRPTLVNGLPARVTGRISYNFVVTDGEREGRQP